MYQKQILQFINIVVIIEGRKKINSRDKFVFEAKFDNIFRKLTTFYGINCNII